MNFLRFFLTAATGAAEETVPSAGGSMDGMLGAMDMLLVVMLLGFGVVGLYSVIRLYREQLLFPNKILYPGDCKPEDCADPGGYIDFIIPRLAILSVGFILMGIAMGILLFVIKLDNAWVNLASMVFPVGGLAWYIVCQRKAAKLFW